MIMMQNRSNSNMNKEQANINAFSDLFFPARVFMTNSNRKCCIMKGFQQMNDAWFPRTMHKVKSLPPFVACATVEFCAWTMKSSWKLQFNRDIQLVAMWRLGKIEQKEIVGIMCCILSLKMQWIIFSTGENVGFSCGVRIVRYFFLNWKSSVSM